MIRYSINNSEFELIELFGKPALFTGNRITFATVEDPLHMYEIQHDPIRRSQPKIIANEVRKNFFGTIISLDKINIGQDGNSITKDDIKHTGRIMNSCEFLSEYYCKKQKGNTNGNNLMES